MAIIITKTVVKFIASFMLLIVSPHRFSLSAAINGNYDGLNRVIRQVMKITVQEYDAGQCQIYRRQCDINTIEVLNQRR